MCRRRLLQSKQVPGLGIGRYCPSQVTGAGHVSCIGCVSCGRPSFGLCLVTFSVARLLVSGFVCRWSVGLLGRVCPRVGMRRQPHGCCFCALSLGALRRRLPPQYFGAGSLGLCPVYLGGPPLGRTDRFG